MQTDPLQAICVKDYPELQLLCWNREADVISPAIAFSLYESHWHLISHESLLPIEAALIKSLADQLGGGLINA